MSRDDPVYQLVMSRPIPEKLIRNLARAELYPIVPIKPSRSAFVLAGVVAGLRNRQIAERLGVSEQAVRHDLVMLRRRYRARNRTHLVACAIRRGDA